MPEPPKTAFDATGNQVVPLLLITGLFVAGMESLTEQEKTEEDNSNQKAEFCQQITGKQLCELSGY